MSHRLNGRVAIVTGAGRGLGREHAVLLASLGAAVVVNDLGGDVHGAGADLTPAEHVVKEIAANGGRAVVSGHDVSDWSQAEEMVRLAVETFGDLHVLVNNAGILRDRTLANMSEDEWDTSIRVHLKGHAACTRHAVRYWRDRAKAGHEVKASVIHTTSAAAFAGNFGQANYSAAKMGIIGLSAVTAMEGERYGIRSNAVSPAARTRITLDGSKMQDALMPPAEPEAFDRYDPANVSPLIAWLADEGCPANAQIFHAEGDSVLVLRMPSIADQVFTDGRWTLEALDQALPDRLVVPPKTSDFHATSDSNDRGL